MCKSASGVSRYLSDTPSRDEDDFHAFATREEVLIRAHALMFFFLLQEAFRASRDAPDGFVKVHFSRQTSAGIPDEHAEGSTGSDLPSGPDVERSGRRDWWARSCALPGKCSRLSCGLRGHEALFPPVRGYGLAAPGRHGQRGVQPALHPSAPVVAVLVGICSVIVNRGLCSLRMQDLDFFQFFLSRRCPYNSSRQSYLN